MAQRNTKSARMEPVAQKHATMSGETDGKPVRAGWPPIHNPKAMFAGTAIDN